MASKRTFATLLSNTTQSSHRLRNVPTFRSTCSQTVTSSLSVLNVSVARVFFKPSVIDQKSLQSARHLHPQRFCTPKSCCHAARTCFNGFFKSMTKEFTLLLRECLFPSQVCLAKKPVNPRVLSGSRVHPALKHSQIRGASSG